MGDTDDRSNGPIRWIDDGTWRDPPKNPVRGTHVTRAWFDELVGFAPPKGFGWASGDDPSWRERPADTVGFDPATPEAEPVVYRVHPAVNTGNRFPVGYFPPPKWMNPLTPKFDLDAFWDNLPDRTLPRGRDANYLRLSYDLAPLARFSGDPQPAGPFQWQDEPKRHLHAVNDELALVAEEVDGGTDYSAERIGRALEIPSLRWLVGRTRIWVDWPLALFPRWTRLSRLSDDVRVRARTWWERRKVGV